MLKGILAISGHGGLFKMVAEAKNNIIVESLTTKKRMPAYSTSKISTLEDIAIFTKTGEVALKDVFKRIFELENGGPCIDSRSSAEELKNYFEKLLPDYDNNRVYISDIKKVLSWYNLLLENEMMDFEEEETEEKEAEDEAEKGSADTSDQ